MGKGANTKVGYTIETQEEMVYAIARHDDRRAFRQLFDMYYPKLLNYAFFILESGIDAQEVVSSLFVKVWSQRNKLSEVNNLESYLYVSVKNLCYNYIRDNRGVILQSLDSEEYAFASTQQNPEKQFLDSELKENILEAIDQLPPKCKLIFRMVREDGMKYAEVAQALQLSVKTVEVQMGRAYAKMRTALMPLVKHQDITPQLKVLKGTKTG